MNVINVTKNSKNNNFNKRKKIMDNLTIELDNKTFVCLYNV